MNIKSIKLENTNPSLGPHEKRTVVSLVVSKDNAATIETFINACEVNRTTKLINYLKAVKNKEEVLLQEVLENSPRQDLKSGSSISNLSFHFEDGQSVRLSDIYRQYELSHFTSEFASYMTQKGTTYQYKPYSDSYLETDAPKYDRLE